MKRCRRLGIAGLVMLAFAGCAGVPVTPTKLEAHAQTDAEAGRALHMWSSAVELANLFLASEFRQTLPPGKISLDADGMRFTSASATMPIRVRCTTFGDLLVKFNFPAQERSWGFIVGRTPGGADRLTSNSLFRHRSGEALGNIAMADIILHELTHMHLKSGLDDPLLFIRYYAEAILLWRYRDHSMERMPFKTTSEYYAFIKAMEKNNPDRFSTAPGEVPAKIEGTSPAPTSQDPSLTAQAFGK